MTVPAWRTHAWLRAGFSTRKGGASTVYAEGGPPEQNLGYTPEDDPTEVAAARQRLVDALVGLDASESAGNGRPELITIRQCHSGVVCQVQRSQLPPMSADGRATLQGDGLYTLDANLLLGILTADCVPVLIADTRTHAVAALHAGWRGTLARIVECGVGLLRERLGCRPQDLIAAIGPSIGPCCFEVGGEVQERFEAEFGYSRDLFTEGPDAVRAVAASGDGEDGQAQAEARVHLNLWEANRRQLLDAGLHPAAITLIGECTSCVRLEDGRRKYFSHRAEQGVTGRMLSLIGTMAR
ncbi:MAG: peptidoglycan editing factor PgeF [Acidobacteriaceae bacterium]